jgi:hypothetical protein
MSLDEIRRGAGGATPPNIDGKWTIKGAKTEGVTPGFQIKDSNGNRYLIKFDPPGYVEMTSAPDIAGSKLFYACGYNVADNYIIWIDPDFDPADVMIDDDVMIEGDDGAERPMTHDDLRDLLSKVDRHPNGKVRCLASFFISGDIVGPFRYMGTRKDDLNDIVPHEHRRELRGLRMIAAWMNHYDTKANNTLDSYVNEDGRRYVKHYLIDFGSALGGGATGPKKKFRGFENTVDPHQMLANTVTLGLWVPAWERERPIMPSVGRFESHLLEPMKYKFLFPNPAFENMSPRDGFWATRIITSFTESQLKAALETGEFSDPDAVDYIARILAERRDIIGRYWFDRVNPLDKFSLVNGGQALSFEDLAVNMGYESAATTSYSYSILRGGAAAGNEVTTDTNIPLPDQSGMVEIAIRTKRTGKTLPVVSVFVEDGKIIALERREH